MTKFESALGSKKITGAPLREYSVSDESEFKIPNRQELEEFQSRFQNDVSNNEEEDLAQVEREIRAARDARKNGKERLNEGAKRRIEMLLNMTKLTRSCELDGNVYEFKTLGSKDMSECFLSASEFDGTVQFPYEIRRQLISRSLTQIAGIEINQFLGSTSLDSKLAFIDELPEALLSRLFNEYQLLVKESNDKYSIKNADDAKGVVEDLKK